MDGIVLDKGPHQEATSSWFLFGSCSDDLMSNACPTR